KPHQSVSQETIWRPSRPKSRKHRRKRRRRFSVPARKSPNISPVEVPKARLRSEPAIDSQKFFVQQTFLMSWRFCPAVRDHARSRRRANSLPSHAPSLGSLLEFPLFLSSRHG